VATLSFLTLLIGEARINGINAARIYGTLRKDWERIKDRRKAAKTISNLPSKNRSSTVKSPLTKTFAGITKVSPKESASY
jgi:hypothetical protein